MLAIFELVMGLAIFHEFTLKTTYAERTSINCARTSMSAARKLGQCKLKRAFTAPPKINIILKTMIENYHAIIPADKTEEKLIEQLLGGSDSKGDASKSDVSRAEPSNLSPEQQKLRNIKVTVEEAIQIVLERLDAMSAELENTTSLEETIEIAKRIRTAKRILFTNPQAGASAS